VRGRDALLGQLDDPQAKVRQAAVQGLSAVVASDESVRDALLGQLDDPDPWAGLVRQAAVQGLAPLIGQDHEITSRFVPWLGSIEEKRLEHLEKKRRKPVAYWPMPTPHFWQVTQFCWRRWLRCSILLLGLHDRGQDGP
jgi:hypothetical protein